MIVPKRSRLNEGIVIVNKDGRLGVLEKALLERIGLGLKHLEVQEAFIHLGIMTEYMRTVISKGP